MTTGIIAEYNPFHNGHAYQINELKEKENADFVVVAMSGDYVQRGGPAIFDKFARTTMALQGGADLVIMLPTSISLASAEQFARGGVSILSPKEDRMETPPLANCSVLAREIEVGSMITRSEPPCKAIVVSANLSKIAGPPRCT